MYPNPFESPGFAGFWLRVEREWAEEEKRNLFYPFDGVNDPDLGDEEDDWEGFEEEDYCEK